MITPRGDGEEEHEKEEEGETEGGVGKISCRLSSCGHGRKGPHGLQVPRLSDPPARDKVVVHEKAKNSARKSTYLRPSNQGERAHETREHSPVAHRRSPLAC